MVWTHANCIFCHTNVEYDYDHINYISTAAPNIL